MRAAVRTPQAGRGRLDEVVLDTDSAQRQFSKDVFAKIKSSQAKGAVSALKRPATNGCHAL